MSYYKIYGIAYNCSRRISTVEYIAVCIKAKLRISASALCNLYRCLCLYSCRLSFYYVSRALLCKLSYMVLICSGKSDNRLAFVLVVAEQSVERHNISGLIELILACVAVLCKGERNSVVAVKCPCSETVCHCSVSVESYLG